MCNIFRYISLAVAAIMLGGCIDNDIPYPVVKLDIVSLDAEGMLSQPVINATNHTVKLSLDEVTDIRKVNISNVVFTIGAGPCRTSKR